MRSKKNSEEGGQSLRGYEMVALPTSLAGRKQVANGLRKVDCGGVLLVGLKEQDPGENKMRESGPVTARSQMCIGQN